MKTIIFILVLLSSLLGLNAQTPLTTEENLERVRALVARYDSLNHDLTWNTDVNPLLVMQDAENITYDTWNVLRIDTLFKMDTTIVVHGRELDAVDIYDFKQTFDGVRLVKSYLYIQNGFKTRIYLYDKIFLFEEDLERFLTD